MASIVSVAEQFAPVSPCAAIVVVKFSLFTSMFILIGVPTYLFDLKYFIPNSLFILIYAPIHLFDLKFHIDRLPFGCGLQSNGIDTVIWYVRRR
jgi:hypothetical protein